MGNLRARGRASGGQAGVQSALSTIRGMSETSPEKRSLIRHPLHTLSGLIAEATRVYRAAREKKLDHAEARSFMWMLAQMRAMVETQALERLEARLEELAPSIEGKTHGYQSVKL
jgi:hypothetical protein